MTTTIIQKIKKNKQTLLNLIADYNDLEKQLSENQNSSKSSFSEKGKSANAGTTDPF